MSDTDYSEYDSDEEPHTHIAHGKHYSILIPKHSKHDTVKPRFTAANFFPQIGLNMHIVNKQNPNLGRNPIYCGWFLSPKTSGKSWFYCNMSALRPATTYPKLGCMSIFWFAN